MGTFKKEKFMKKQSGSVTLFVLIAMIFFLIVCFFIYTNSNNKKISQSKELEQLKKNYEQNKEELDEEYEEIQNSNLLIEFSPNGGEYLMPTDGNALIKAKAIVTSNKTDTSVTKIYYQWSNSIEEPTNWENTMENYAIIEKKDCEIGTYYFWVKAVDNRGEETIGRSNGFIVREGKIKVSYNTALTKGPLDIKITFDTLLTKNHRIGYGNTNTSATSSAKNVTVSNSSTNMQVKENGYMYIEATDEIGNKVYSRVQITNIDNIGPEIEINPNGGEYELQYIIT